MVTTKNTKQPKAKHVTPKAGRKMTFEEASKHNNKKYDVDLTDLAK